MTSSSVRTLSLVMLVLSGCSCGEVTTLDAGRDAPISSLDARPTDDAFLGGDVDGLSDTPPALDALATTDAPSAADVGVDASPDAASGCPRVVEDRFAGICDGRGRAICEMWATASAGGAPASAICLGTDGLCARASECTGTTLDTCRCGSGPACGASEVCISGFAGYSCTCAP